LGASNLPCAGAMKHVKAFEQLGWVVARTHGSHIIMSKTGNPHPASIPSHTGKDVKRHLLAALLKKVGITEADYLTAFKGK
jgi:predicted RNA binding protein YcfA (HicA-like mRNA interferase family)